MIPTPDAARTNDDDVAVEPEAEQTILDRKRFFELVVERAGVNKKTARELGDAVLAIMGEALSDGHGLALEPFGKASVVRQKDTANGEVLTLKLRRRNTSQAEKNNELPPLADDGD